MSGLTLKRLFISVAVLLSATSVFAGHPSQRTLARMAFHEADRVAVLFGGRGNVDAATTNRQHASDETWVWNGGRWLQRHPATVPSARDAHHMVYDSQNARVIMFGGRVEPADRLADPTFLDDTWAWKNGDWTRIDGDSAQRPTPRHDGGMAYDRVRNRTILYGGSRLSADGNTIEVLYDTWEFDGTSWTRIAENAPKLVKPEMAYDIAGNMVVMVGLNEDGTQRIMYRYDPEAESWVNMAPTAMPPCVNEANLVYRTHTQKLLVLGGLCETGTTLLDKGWEYNRTTNTWAETKIGVLNRIIHQAVTYDPIGGDVIIFGGTTSLTSGISSFTVLMDPLNQFSSPARLLQPTPRSLNRLEPDSSRGTVWLFGGLDETTEFFKSDLWAYRDGSWYQNIYTSGPGECATPVSAYDTNRSRLVVVCNGQKVFEWDGAVWKAFPNLQKEPNHRTFGSMVYDENLKKVVLFGGYQSSNYRNDTWTWDGTTWVEVDVRNNQRPPHRGIFAMWYDPLQKKTILYGGLGRGSINEKITRYSDMWSFNGTAWTKIDTPTPGTRFGPQVAVNPTTGKLLLFGGLRSEAIDEDSLRQFFDNETWEWDGAASKWTKLDPQTVPAPRENGSMSWDPTTGQMVMFAGYANGFYLSDVWAWTGTDWVVREPQFGRKRTVRH